MRVVLVTFPLAPLLVIPKVEPICRFPPASKTKLPVPPIAPVGKMTIVPPLMTSRSLPLPLFKVMVVPLVTTIWPPDCTTIWSTVRFEIFVTE